MKFVGVIQLIISIYFTIILKKMLIQKLNEQKIEYDFLFSYQPTNHHQVTCVLLHT